MEGPCGFRHDVHCVEVQRLQGTLQETSGHLSISLNKKTPALEPFDRLKPSHRSLNDHVPDMCPECIKLGTWCDSSRAISKRTPRECDKALLRLVRSPPPKWQRCDTGLEIFLDPTQWRVPDANDGSLYSAAFRECSTRRYRITLTPINFLFPTGKQKLVLEKSIQSGLLLRHKPPQSLNTFSDVLTARNFAAREKVSGREEGAWYNRVVDLFLRADEFAAPQWEGGFLRFPFFRPDEEPASLASWHTAYHGTSRANAGKIFFGGELKKPETRGQIAHGQAGSQTGSTIYVSPAKELSSFPVYSEIFQLNPHRKPSTPKKQGDLVTNKFAQVVYEVKVKPRSYRIKPSTLSSNRHWPRSLRIDPRFATHDDLEWLLESSDDVVLSAILVRQRALSHWET